jgi:hypothetical protein
VKIIFSRKGFDSQYGGVASPILPDGSVLSLPIPSRYGRPLGDLAAANGPLHRIVSDLTAGRITASTLVHLDPDLQADCVDRLPSWRASFGQVSSAQQHLVNQGVGTGDVFLFFGWYRRVETHEGRWRYVPGAPDVHSFFGWLQVGDVVKVDRDPVDLRVSSPWLRGHPHVEHAGTIGNKNTLYLGADTLTLATSKSVAGAGVFRRWTEALQLTAPGESRSVWRLPRWFMPGEGLPPLTYHGAQHRWSLVSGHARLESVGKGQEFVQDLGTSTEARAWLGSLISAHA